METSSFFYCTWTIAELQIELRSQHSLFLNFVNEGLLVEAKKVSTMIDAIMAAIDDKLKI